MLDPPPLPPPLPPPPTLDLVQLAELRSLSPEGDRWLVRELLAPFLRDGWLGLAAMRAALAAHDATLLETTAHNLKGAAGTVGARALEAIARRLMEAALRVDWTQIPSDLAALEAELPRVHEQIRQAIPDADLSDPASA